MKIAVITRMLRKDRLEGFGVFTHELLSRIVREHPEHTFYFLFDRNYSHQFVYEKNVHPVVLFPPASHPKLLVLWYQYVLPWYLNRLKPDILISPDGGIPLKTRVKTLAVIHDLNFEHFPGDLPEGVRNYYLNYYREIAQKATRLVTVSRYSRWDLQNTYKVDPDKIDVVFNAVGNQYRPLELNETKLIRDQYSSSKPYFLFVGSIHQRKNLPVMMNAFSQFRQKTSMEMKFIIAGAKRWWNEEMEAAFEGSAYKQDIIFTGRVDERELPKLTGAAFALLFASRFEGFGIPILEAMQCGVPVITSNVTAMPEVAGDAALLVNPESVDSVCDAMIKIATDKAVMKNLVVKGIERATHFSWDHSAELFWKSIEKTVSQ